MSDDKAPTSTVRKKHFFQPNQPEIETSGSALINLGFYSFLMFTVPLGIFFPGCRQLESSKYLVSVLDSKCDIEVSASLDQSNNLCYLISEVYSQKCLIQSANLNRYSSG